MSAYPRLALAALACAGLLSPVCAATLNVPAQYQTIQAAIAAANPGDIVLIADGTFQGAGNVNLDFGGKAITVTSQHGAAKTVIDCQSQFGTEGVIFSNAEPAAAKLQGVTIENGDFPGGGIGVFNGSSPTISNCILLHNSAFTGNGGGLLVESGSPLLIGCTFQGNTASKGGGAAMLLDSGASSSFVNCTFVDNTSVQTGGGLFFVGSGVLSGCTFSGNQAASGAGVYHNGSSISIVNTTFTGNTASTVGGGLDTIGSVTLVNSTLTQNTAPTGGGLYNDTGGSSTLTNSILYGDSGGEIFEAALAVGLTVTHSDVQGGQTGTGNLSAPPLFGLAAGDLHLRGGSPCQRAGTSTGAPTTDKDGTVRPLPPSIGAYETGPVLIPDIADSAVFSSTPTQNFGTAPTLVLAGFLGTAYAKFDLTTLGELAPTSTVKLHLSTASTGTSAGAVVVSATTSGWTESGLTFKTRPLLTQPLGIGTVVPSTPGTDVDITSYVKSQQALGQTQISVGLTQFSTGLAVSFDSKESSAGDPPQLVVTY